jgi:hypothetical protein
VVYALLQAGLVELVKPPSSQAPKTAQSPRRASSPANPQAAAIKRSVVERLITKIKDA